MNIKKNTKTTLTNEQIEFVIENQAFAFVAIKYTKFYMYFNDLCGIGIVLACEFTLVYMVGVLT